MSFEGRLNNAAADIPNLVELVTQGVVEKLGYSSGPKKVHTSPPIVTKECPRGTVTCDVAAAKALGYTCPLMTLAGQQYAMVDQSGRICSLNSDINKLTSNSIVGRADDVDRVIQKLGAYLLTKDEKLVAKLLFDTTSNPSVVVDSKRNMLEKEGLFAFKPTKESDAEANSFIAEVQAGLSPKLKFEFKKDEPMPTVVVDGESDSMVQAVLRGISAFGGWQEANIKDLDTTKSVEEKYGVTTRIGKIIRGLQRPASEAEYKLLALWLTVYPENSYMRAVNDSRRRNGAGEFIPVLDKKGNPTGRFEEKTVKRDKPGVAGVTRTAAGAELEGGATPRRSGTRASASRSTASRSTASRTSPRRSESRSASPSPERASSRRDEGGLTTRVAAVKTMLGDAGEVANFYTKECPVKYNDRRFVTANSSYAECERRLGFRWVSEKGHCYPEGLCSIPQDDIVDKTEVLQSKLMLATTLTQVYNKLQLKDRNDFISKKSVELMAAYKRTPEYLRLPVAQQAAVTARKFRDEAKQMLPANLMELPEESVILLTDELVKSVGADAPTDLEEEFRFTKQAFLQAYADEIARTGNTNTTKAADRNVRRFVQDSIFCTKANTTFNGILTQDQINTALKSTPDQSELTVGAVCKWLPLENGGFFMPKEAANRASGGDSADPVIRNSVMRAFQAGQDPLAKAFRFTSERYLSRAKTANSVIENAYSPKRLSKGM